MFEEDATTGEQGIAPPFEGMRKREKALAANEIDVAEIFFLKNLSGGQKTRGEPFGRRDMEFEAGFCHGFHPLVGFREIPGERGFLEDVDLLFDG